MPGTRVSQVRKPIVTDEGSKYQIVLTCTLPGTLPSAAIFVMEVTQDNDPKNDTFRQLCTSTDFLTYSASRSQSITDGTRLYRAPAVTLVYDSLAEANGAWQELTARINALVQEYDAYETEFLTSDAGVEVTFPTIDPSQKAALIAAYEERLVAVADAEGARDAGQRVCDAHVVDLTSVQAQLTQAQSDYAAVLPIKAAIDALPGPYTVMAAQIGSAASYVRYVNSASAASADDKARITAQIDQIDSALSVLNTTTGALVADVQTPFSSYVASLQVRVADLTQQVNAAQIQVNECNLEMAALQAAVDEARKQRDAALATLRAVCADYNPEDSDSGILAATIPVVLGGSP